MKKPTRPSGPKSPQKMSSNTKEHHTHLERSYAQKIRVDRQGKGPAYASMAKRAAFWRQIQDQQAQQVQQSLDNFTSNVPLTQVDFAGANIHQSTLQSAAPQDPSNGISVAGIGDGGIVPPPPPSAV